MFKKYNRKSNRLYQYDYDSEGYYFVTLCVKDRCEYFGYIKNNTMILNKYGKIVEKFWNDIPKYYKNVVVEEFVVMPNHIHGIIHIVGTGQCKDKVGTGHCPVPTDEINYGLLSKIVNSFKNVVTKEIRKQLYDYEFKWQRSFYDHIIRDEGGLQNIYQYIIENPLMWGRDRNNDY